MRAREQDGFRIEQGNITISLWLRYHRRVRLAYIAVMMIFVGCTDDETGETVEVSFGALAELFLQVFSIPELAEQIPLFITGVVEGNADLLSDELAFLIFLAGLGEVPEDIDPFDMPEESERAPRAPSRCSSRPRPQCNNDPRRSSFARLR